MPTGEVATASERSAPGGGGSRKASARKRVEAAPEVFPVDPPVAVEATPQVIRSVAGTVIDPVSLLFDTDWYRSEYPDVAAAGLDPIRHFFDNGAREGRQPNALFDTSWYVSANADVAASMMNPFLHYLLYGAREGRKSRP